MPKAAPKADSSRKPPVPTGSHAEIDDWLRRVMPDLHPVVTRMDELIRDAIPGLQFAVKWRKAYYGVPEHGWVIEMTAYDVSANLVFFAGAEMDPPPPLGTTGRSRYVKVRDLDDLEDPAVRAWIEQAAHLPGWR